MKPSTVLYSAISSKGSLHDSAMVSEGQCCPDCSAQEITQDYLNRLQAAEPKVQSFISVAAESACAAARALDDRIASDGVDSLGPLAAVPLGVKVCAFGCRQRDQHGLSWCLRNPPISSGPGTTRQAHTCDGTCGCRIPCAQLACRPLQRPGCLRDIHPLTMPPLWHD